MTKELEKNYNPEEIEGRLYKKWEDAGYFHAEVDENKLKVPLWFWNSNEWCAFAQASGKSQKPTLINTLRSVRSGIDAPVVDGKIASLSSS